MYAKIQLITKIRQYSTDNFIKHRTFLHVFIILFEVLADSNNCINIPQHLFLEKIELLIKLFNIYFLV